MLELHVTPKITRIALIADFFLTLESCFHFAIQLDVNVTFLLCYNRPFYSCLLSDLAFKWKRG